MVGVDGVATTPWFVTGSRELGGPGPVSLLSRDDVTRCLERLDPVEIVRDTLVAHADGRTVLPAEAYLRWDNGRGAYTRSIAMPGGVVWDGRPPAYGLKVINASVSNPAVGLERAGGVGLCFDPETARITAIVEVGLVSAVRTAAVSLLGVQGTGHTGAGSLAVVGCGTQGGTHLFLFLERLPNVRHVALCDRDPRTADQLAERVARTCPQVTVSVHRDASAAMRGAALVVTTTTADDGYIPPEWIAPGALVVNVSLADLTPAALLGAGALYVDDVDLVADNPRRPLGRLMRDGHVVAPRGVAPGGVAPDAGVRDAVGDGPKRIDGTLGALLSGRVAAVPDAQPYTVLNPFGMGVLDVALLAAIRDTALGLGVGTEVALG